MKQDDVLPLPDRFPAHTVAKFKGKESYQLLTATLQLVNEYFDKVGLPGRPIVPVAGALPFDLRRTQGELRLRLVGVVGGEMLGELTQLCGMHSAGDESLVFGIFARPRSKRRSPTSPAAATASTRSRPDLTDRPLVFAHNKPALNN
jgi:hypothetical protein